jgi:hypothetical protein
LAILSVVPAAGADDSAPASLAKWSVTAPNQSPNVYSNGSKHELAELGNCSNGIQLSLTSVSPYKSLQYSTQEWYESTFWTGPDWTRVGDRWHHPGELTPSIRRFNVPRDGQITITGRVFKLHLEGDGVRAAIHHNDREIWSAEIECNDDRGADPNLSIAACRGDSIRFIVDKRGDSQTPPAGIL